MSPDDVKRLLAAAATTAPLPPDLRDATVRYRFDVRDAGSWILKLNRGLWSLEADGGAADCVVACSREDFPKLLNGERNLLTAWMRGDVDLQGDPAFGKLLHTYGRYARAGDRKKEAV